MKNIYKHIFLALVVGLIVGAIDALFGRVLIWITDFRTIHYLWLLPFLPLAGLLITWLYHRFNKESLGGMTLIFETRLDKRKDIPLALIPLVMVGTWITHLFGGSAGREGVAVQIGATISHWLGKKCHLPDNSKILLVTGMAAGFAGLFQTPLAATFFAMEVVIAGYLDVYALLPAILASYAACFTSSFLGLPKFAIDLQSTLSLHSVHVIGSILILGIAFGLTGRLFASVLAKAKTWMKHAFPNPYRRIGLVSIPLAIVLILLFGGRYSGLGTNLITNSFTHQTIYAWDWILKLGLTILTLSIGFQGGEVTPLFSIGASLGVVLGSLLGLDPLLCAALGYAAVFGSATNTLLAPIFIGLEVFGGVNMIPFTLVCIIAYLVNGNHSIYTAQSKVIY